MKYVLAIAVVLIACCALLLRSGPEGGAPNPVIVNGAPASVGLPGGTAGISVSHQQPPRPTTQQLTDPRQLYASLRSEPRDVAWASRSEAFIRSTLVGNANIGADAPLDVRCATSLCEASGVAAAGAQADAVQRAWDSLKGTIDTPLIAAHGLRYVTATFGSGHSIHAFTIYYQRRPE